MKSTPPSRTPIPKKPTGKPDSRPRNYLAPLLFIAVVATGGVAWWQYQAQQTPAPSTAPSVPPEREPAMPSPPDEIAASQELPAHPNRSEVMSNLNEQMTDPQVQAFINARIQEGVAQAYEALFQQLNLPPAELASLQNLLVQRAGAFRDVMANLAALGPDQVPTREQFQQQLTAAQAKVDTSIQSLLNDAQYQAYQAYQATVDQAFRGAGGDLGP